jgi:hypothetical protein
MRWSGRQPRKPLMTSRHPSGQSLPPVQAVAERVFVTLERFLHVEAVGGIVRFGTPILVDDCR